MFVKTGISGDGFMYIRNFYISIKIKNIISKVVSTFEFYIFVQIETIIAMVFLRFNFYVFVKIKITYRFDIGKPISRV